MTSKITFYLSRIIGRTVTIEKHNTKGKLKDLLVDLSYERPKVIAAKISFGNQSIIIDISHLTITKHNHDYLIKCDHIEEVTKPNGQCLFLVKHVLDKQIVDIDDKKLQRVNDLRLVILSSGIFLLAVDVGFEGLMRRLSLAKPINGFLNLIGKSLPGKFIIWDDVAAIGQSQTGIKLSKEQSKLSTLHPSDLADIIEELDKKSQVAVFESLDDEKAADVLEELETAAQVNVIEGLSLEKAADVLEKMPADEVADILDDLEEHKAEELLSEMESEASDEVRDLMDYPENTVGSLMSKDFLWFNQNFTTQQAIDELRRIKPESSTIYYLYVLDDEMRLIATVSLRDLVIAEPETRLHQIMNRKVTKIQDYDKIGSLAETISKYNLLAIPVVDVESKMQGIVIIDDVIFTLLKAKKRLTLRED